MLYNLILKSKASFLDRMFTYAYPSEIEIGSRVIVPFGRANVKTIAIVVEKLDENKLKLDYEAKEIVEVLDNKPILNKELLDIAFYMIEKNISDYSSAINSILPAGSIDQVEEFYIANIESQNHDKDLAEFLDVYRSFEEIEDKFPNKYTKSKINDMCSLGVIDSIFDIKAKAAKKYIEIVSLLDNDPISKLSKSARKQISIINSLLEENIQEKKSLLENANSSLSSLKSLVDKGLIQIEKKQVYREVLDKVDDYDRHKLNDDQQKVFDAIVNSDKTTFLLKGVTGSGKTEVYLQLVEKYLKEGKEAIILVPEISLTPQTIARFQGRFGRSIAVLHSKLSVSERADQWRMIKNKKVKIVVGARSAIFAPFENLGIIIIDEEHESSYKSEKNPKYSAIEIAKFRANYQGAKLLLGTATPSVKSMFDVYNSNTELLRLDKRVNNNKMPKSYVIDMREELKSNNFTMFSYLLQKEIRNSLERKEQVILFLNKRGHTSFVFCRSCGYVHRCEACDVAMTYHKSNDRLICHYCGRTGRKASSCPSCGSRFIKEYGAGTEMLEEHTKQMFPEARVYRMDADTTSNKSDYEKVYKMMKNGEIDILIGTQMLAKGLDFPNVSLVGLVSADISLNVSDFRAGEKTYNLITQVAGRAGRANIPGKVIIQTYSPDHYAIKNAAENNYEEYFIKEIKERQMFRYPPIVNILNINISSKDRSYAVKYGQGLMLEITSVLRKNFIKLIEMTGPTPSIIERINNRYRFDIKLKSDKKEDLLIISNELRKLDRDNKIYINYNLEED